MQARAEASLKNAVALREQQALDRIAQSEAAATKQVRDTAVDVALSATRDLSARAGRRGPQRGPDQRGDRRAAAAPALTFFEFELPAQNQSRATWGPRRKAGAFSLFMLLSSPVFGGGYRRGRATGGLSQSMI